MDIAEAMREASTEYSLQLTTDDTAEMQTYLSTVLTRHAEGALLHEAAVGELMMLCMLINTGDKQGLNRRIREFIQQEKMAGTGPVRRAILPVQEEEMRQKRLND